MPCQISTQTNLIVIEHDDGMQKMIMGEYNACLSSAASAAGFVLGSASWSDFAKTSVSSAVFTPSSFFCWRTTETCQQRNDLDHTFSLQVANIINIGRGKKIYRQKAEGFSWRYLLWSGLLCTWTRKNEEKLNFLIEYLRHLKMPHS